MRRVLSLVAGCVAAVLVVGLAVIGGKGLMSGWVYNAPLPGGADVGSHPLTLSADFADVLDLVPQSSVKVDNVSVGRVKAIHLNSDGRSARVTLTVNRSADLPAGTTARLQQTSLLGEKYVALIRPTTGSAGSATSVGSAGAAAPLADGARLGLADTSAAADVEQVLGALSMVLNGGGVGQFQEISRELQAISTDRPDQIRGFLDQLNRFVSTLDAKKSSITGALDGLAALSARLDADKSKITTALDGLSPGMKVLVDQRQQLVAMLASLDKLSTVTVKTLDASQKDIVADFKALDPILTQLARAGSDLPASLQILLTYPFPDSVLGAIKGDYLNVFVTTNFRTLPTGCAEGGCAWPQVGGGSAGAAHRSSTSLAGPGSTPPTLLPPTSTPTVGAPSSSLPAPSLLPSVTAGQTATPGSHSPTPTSPLSPASSSSAPSPKDTADPPSAPAVTGSSHPSSTSEGAQP